MPSLPRKLGFPAALAIIVGSIIGSGVFMKPSSMAAVLGSPLWLTAVWVIAGLFTVAGAFIYAELGAMWPETGGLYRYFKRIFGDFAAFLYGWAAFSVINTAAIAAIAFVCAEYSNYFFQLPGLRQEVVSSFTVQIPFVGVLYPLENLGVKILAILYVIFFTALSARSTRAGGTLQIVSTAIKLLLILGMVGSIFLLGKGDTGNFTASVEPMHGSELLSGVILAMTGAFFAYDGWTNVTFVAGEIRDPQRNLPRSLLVGVTLVILIYILINQAYLYALPVEAVAGSSLVAADAMQNSLGSESAGLVALMVIISTLGALNGNILATPRVTFAMAADGLFFRWFGKENERRQTPARALWLHGAWCSVLILSGSFNMLADMFVFITWIAYMVGAIGVMILRKREKSLLRPYKMPFYPWLPLAFIFFTGFYLVYTVFSDVINFTSGKQPVINSFLGMILTLAGVPVYFLCRKKRRPGHPSS